MSDKLDPTMTPHLFLVFSAFLLALGAVLAKWLLTGGLGSDIQPLNPLTFLIAQLVGSLVLLVGVCVIAGHQPSRHLASLIVPGVIIGGGSICTILALHFMTASEASLIFATQPVIVLPLAWAFLRERVTAGVILCIIAAVLGVIGIVQTGMDIGSLNRPLVIGFAIVSTTCAAIYVVWMRHVSGGAAPVLSLLALQSVALVVAISAWLLAGLPGGMLVDPLALAAAAVTGAIHYGAAFLFYLVGLERIEASKAGIYLSLVPVFTVGLAFLWLGEVLTPLQMAGGALVLLAVSGVALLSLRQGEKPA